MSQPGSLSRAFEYNPGNKKPPKRGGRKDSTPQVVRVTNPREESGRWGKHVTYSIFVDVNGKLYSKDVRRRYSDFVWLRMCLSKKFPGVLVAPLPCKKMLGKNQHFVERRRGGLQKFLVLVLESDLFNDSGPLKAFLSPDNFEEEKKVEEKKAEARSISDLILDYEVSLLKGTQDDDLPREPLEQMLNLRDFLDDSHKTLTKIQDGLEVISARFFEISNHMQRMNNAFDELQKAEDLFTGEAAPEHKVCVFQGFCTLFENVRSQPVGWERDLLACIECEVGMIQAMKEALATWMTYNSQLNKAIARLKKHAENAAGGKTPNPKHLPKLEADMKSEKRLREFQQVLTRIMLKHNLMYMWDFKVTKFRGKMKKFISMQKWMTEEDVKMWTSLCRGMAEFKSKFVIPRSLGLESRKQ